MTALAQAGALLGDLLIQVPATKTTTGNSGNGVDRSSYDGVCKVQLASAIGTGNADNTLDAKMQESDTSGGTFTDIAGATFTQVTGAGSAVIYSCVVDLKKCKKFIRAAWTIAGTSPSFVFGITAAPLAKYR